MHIENETWYKNIFPYSLQSYPIFQCKNTKIEIPFEINMDKIKEYYETNYPKWVGEDKYRLVSKRLWGLGKNLRLYIHEERIEFIIESTY